MEKEKSKRNLLNTNLDYSDGINIPNYQFGIEIEFSGANFVNIDRKLDELFGYDSTDANELEKKILNKKQYKYWNLVNDSTVQDGINYFSKTGGEINLPIMKNEKKYWQELKQVCEMLRESESISISGNCGLHIHTDMGIFKVLQEYKNLLKIWILYEDIIYRFGYGENNQPRKALLKYAKPFSYDNLTPKILENLNAVGTTNDLVKLLKFNRKYGLNLTNIIKEQTDEIGKNKIRTIEIRIYNGTLNEKIIQNNVRFNMNLLNYCKNENFDEEFIEYKLNQFEPFYINDSLKEQPEKVDEFSKLIFKDELDRLKFLKQYYKIYNEFDIEKTLHL